jgi:hypothetical protein
VHSISPSRARSNAVLKKCIAHRAQHRLGILASKEKGAYLSRTNPSAHDRQLAFRKDDVELAQLEEYIFL